MLWAQIVVLVLTVITFFVSLVGASREKRPELSTVVTVIAYAAGFALHYFAGTYDLIF